jgi:DNA-binding Xre family transcriptional regulator
MERSADDANDLEPEENNGFAKAYLSSHGVEDCLAECAGVQLSLTSVSALINKTPDVLRVRTMQAICNALNCKLSEFCEIEPDDFAPG